MFIHWFPGHMTKAIRAMRKDMAIVNSVIYVIDSRAPKACINPTFDEIIGNKPRLYVLNKADLVPKEELDKWLAYFKEQPNSGCIWANSTKNTNSAVFINALKTLNEEKIVRFKNRGVKKTIRAMVIGVPNCGKSTLINSLIAKKKTITGNRPGVTRSMQWVSIDQYIDLVDTPGTLYPDFSDQEKATYLAMIGSINDDILDITELAAETIKYLCDNNYKEAFKLRYNLQEIRENSLDNLTAIAKQKGFLLKGGQYDLERASKAVVNDFRKQAFGKIILEKI
ncbi:MAG: ribosome biogenesis GTPase YlqF [Clostridiales bacterium]|nr:ribosome biogenesis GTPase YlqF [Clostridiales bacterium]